MNAPDVLTQVAGELRKECSCVVGGPNHGQCLSCDLSDRIETARAAVAELIAAHDEYNAADAAWAAASEDFDREAMKDATKRCDAAQDRIDAALARCKGAQA